MNNSKKGLGIIIVLFIVLIGVLTLGILKEKKMQKDSESQKITILVKKIRRKKKSLQMKKKKKIKKHQKKKIRGFIAS